MNMLGWQHYRSVINGSAAVFAVNLDDLAQFQQQGLEQILQFSIPYAADGEGLPEEGNYELLLARISMTVSQLNSVPPLFFAGYFLAEGKATLHFYTPDAEPLQAVLQTLAFAENISVQNDPNWDIYFDFLLASPLELKLNATDELLAMLRENGRDLADTYLVEHTFHFDQEEKMFPFMEELTLGNYTFVTLKYASQPIQDSEDDEPYYMVKLEQEMAFDRPDIFEQIELFDELATRFDGEYHGWECDSLNHEKKQLLQ